MASCSFLSMMNYIILIKSVHVLLQIQVDDNGKIIDAKFKTFGCGSAIASSSLATEWVKGKTVSTRFLEVFEWLQAGLSLHWSAINSQHSAKPTGIQGLIDEN